MDATTCFYLKYPERFRCLIFFVMLLFMKAGAQDSLFVRTELDIPFADVPQYRQLPYKTPSMLQSLEISKDFYELSFAGINKLSNLIFFPKTKHISRKRKVSKRIFSYALSLAFCKFGSELPVPLGVWGHEEFHRSVLGVKGINSKNGNWLFHRWDGTVYGIPDETLSHLKANNLNTLLYSYVAGVHYEIALNERMTVSSFMEKGLNSASALLLYNSYYVYNYFSFASGKGTDEVKRIAPQYESKDHSERDFAGSDLTAWVYDMYHPEKPYLFRDSFPDGEGVNRRIGISDLTPEAISFLRSQKALSLLNFVNPSVFFLNQIPVTKDFSFLFFTQYAPTHFGNSLAFFLPVRYKKLHMLFDVKQYNNHRHSGYGAGIGLLNYEIAKRLRSDISVDFWMQPRSFYTAETYTGGALAVKMKAQLNQRLSAYVSSQYKTAGWMMSNPYLSSNLSMQLGLQYRFNNRVY